MPGIEISGNELRLLTVAHDDLTVFPPCLLRNGALHWPRQWAISSRAKTIDESLNLLLLPPSACPRLGPVSQQSTNEPKNGRLESKFSAGVCMHATGQNVRSRSIGTIGRYRTSPLGVSSHETFQQSEKDRSRALGVNHKPVFDGGWHISVHGFRSKPGRPGMETNGTNTGGFQNSE